MNTRPFQKIISSLLIVAQLVAPSAYAVECTAEMSDRSPPLSARSTTSIDTIPAALPSSLEVYQRLIRTEDDRARWFVSDQGLRLVTRGRVSFLDGLVLDKNICIETDGEMYFGAGVTFNKDVALQAHTFSMPQGLKVKGFVRLWGETLTLGRGVLDIENGAQVALKTVINRGTLSVQGVGLGGVIDSLTNEGKIDLSSAQVTIKDTKNKAVWRTRGHCLLQGDDFSNEGTMFTAGVHQLTLRNRYDDRGHLYVHALLLLNAGVIEFQDGHQAWLREALINASSRDLTVAQGARFYLQSSRTPCLLQLSSQGNLTYNGTTIQSSSVFPFAIFDDIWTQPQRHMHPQSGIRHAGHWLAKIPLSLDAWGHIRRPEWGVAFHTNQNACSLNGSVQLTSGSVRKSVKGRLVTDGLKLDAGHFRADGVTVGAQDVFLDNTTLSALAGQVSILVSHEASLRGTTLLGADAAMLTAQTLTLQDHSLIRSLMGPTFVSASGSAVVSDSTLQAHTTTTLRGRDVDAHGMTMAAERRSHVSAERTATIKDSHTQGETQIEGTHTTVTHHTGEGTTAIVGTERATVGDAVISGDLAVHSQSIVRFEDSVRATGTVYGQAPCVVNKGTTQATSASLVADHLEQNGTVRVEETATLVGRESYTGTDQTLNEAKQKVIIIAPQTRRLFGVNRSSAFQLNLGLQDVADLLDLESRVEALNCSERPKIFGHFPQADLQFTEDTTLAHDLYLQASRFGNETGVQLTALGDLQMHLATSATNLGNIHIRGQGFFDAPDFITSRGSWVGDHGLGLHTNGLLTHKGLFSGGKGALHLRGGSIDAAAEGLDRRSVFLGDAIDAYAESDFLADGAIVRGRDVSLGAGDLLRLGAFKKTFHSEEHESGFLGLSHTTTRRTWQEAVVFDAQGTQSLKLFSLRGQVKGEGARLSSPFMKIHGEKGTFLNELRLTRTEDVEKTRACFVLGGFDLFGPFEDGIPMPKPSAEVGTRVQRTRTTQSYGIHGHMDAGRLELSTGASAVVDLQGSDLRASYMVSDTSSLRLGGSIYESSQTASRCKFTAGVAYVGAGFVPTASISASGGEDRVRSIQAAQVHIGHFENRRGDAQIDVANGIQGGIQAISGDRFRMVIDHTQTVMSQSGWSAGGGFTGNSINLSGGGRGGEQRTSDGTSFSTPVSDLLTRVDHQHENTDTRWGVSGSIGFSFGEGSAPSLTQWGGSVQFRGQTFAFDSAMVDAWKAQPSSGATSSFEQTLASTRHFLEQASAVGTMVSNVTSAVALMGVDTRGIHRILDPMETALHASSQVLSACEKGYRFWDQLTSKSQEERAPSTEGIAALSELSPTPEATSDGLPATLTEEEVSPSAPAAGAAITTSRVQARRGRVNRGPAGVHHPIGSPREAKKEKLRDSLSTDFAMLYETGEGGGRCSLLTTFDDLEGNLADSLSDAERFQGLQASTLYTRDPDPQSERNRLIEEYESLLGYRPETYTGNIYPKALLSSATLSNYSAAAECTAQDPTNNRARWALQTQLLQYGIKYGSGELNMRAASSAEFSYQIHESAFQFANDVSTIGHFPWLLLTGVDVPAYGRIVGDWLYKPGAIFSGTGAGLSELAYTHSYERANKAFSTVYSQELSKKDNLGCRVINWTIETTNSPHGVDALPWYGRLLRSALDEVSVLSRFYEQK